ncbi:myo-inositol 2-dehydrogenase/D-chiro-inositol 1-dehydrogenase [Herbihabitans rhizosphaerae]|uniref:Myo-inositol 2-dehydrogenase/D-chiro-inositol 1-dehydrogenase n=1 Tax=Herbihabitans rhizosphaerae TaxID=1872711 RepID=A0A4Q7KMJ6_9PSEU|nr:Gfo/Idh/MocA family oxidoreductase [Herbihabitans rhizosphaerae]RZS36422.1 myo-inositol 2-dehydrogenase/D-chiro-inositol 1-dehydrogenase [Herbihabitans rhizosphaerae]
MRIGVAGVGRIGTMHAGNLASLDAVDEVLLFDPVAGRAGQAAGGLGPRTSAVDDLDALLANSDGVVIATPTDTHPEMLRRCVAARTPALCEKPLAEDIAAVGTIVEEIEASGVDVVVGFQRRFDPAIVELHRRLRAGEVGRVYQVRSVCNDHQPPPKEFIASSGGLFRDCLIHDLDAVPWLVGQPVVEVFASGSVLVDDVFAEVGDVDNAIAVLRFAGGAHAMLSAARHDPVGYDCRIEVFGSGDTLTVGLDPRTPLTSLEPDGPRVGPDPYPGFPERFHRAYVNELVTFLDVIAGRVENPSPARESLISLRLAEACEQSRRTGAPVRTAFEEVPA